MAFFIATVDRSAEGRSRFAERAQRELSLVNGSPAQSFMHGDLAMVSWTQEGEPFRHATSAHGLSCIWGHAMEQGQHVSKTPDLADLWRSIPERMPSALEGIHAALLYRADGSWIAGADVLGLMPVYYHCGEDFVIVGSSPDLFRMHPRFQASLDVAGLAGILLTNGLVAGRSLLKGIQRLEAGHLLHAQPRKAPRELSQYRPEVSDRYFGASYEENFEHMEEVLQDCFDRHLAAEGRHGLILSGGLDSRLVAAITRRQGIRFDALSFGSAQDIEMQCAVAVAKAMDLQHQMLPDRMEHYVDHAERECKWKHLANGFSGLPFHEAIPDAEKMQGGMLSGYIMEAVIGGDHISWAGEQPDEMSFDTLFKKINRWGMPPQTVKQLLAGSCGPELVDEVKNRLEQAYHGYADREFQKSWLFGLRHRSRYHTSAVLGLHSRWPWPVVPYIDTKMLDLMGGMPYEHVRKRRMQYDLLRGRYPDLARLPLDRNSFNMKPLLPRYGRQIDRVLYKVREIFHRRAAAGPDRRFYYRVFDFSSSGWNAVRRVAEPNRKKVLHVLDETILAEILPQPGQRFAVVDGIIDASKMKLLTGFLLWSRNYL